MAETIYMRVGERDRVDLPDLVTALGSFLGILKDVDATIARRMQGNLVWRVTVLDQTPTPRIGVTPRARGSREDISSFVQREVIRNMTSLTNSGERNRDFSDSALARVGKIARTTSRIGSSTIYIDSRQPIHSTIINQQTLSKVKDLTDVKSRSFGTVVGELGSISVRRGNEFRIWDEDADQPVRCNFSHDDERKIKDLLRHRIMVTGIVNSNRYGLPLSISVESIDHVPLGNLPDISHLAGSIPDFTGGLSLQDFLEEME